MKFEKTVWYDDGTLSIILQKQYKSCCNVFNDHYHDAPVVNEYVYSNTSAFDAGSHCSHIFVDNKYIVEDVYGVNMDAEFVNILEDSIQHFDVMTEIISDLVQSEIRIHLCY